MRIWIVKMLCSGVAALAIGSLTFGGDLNPPAGPPSPTMKSLDAVRPGVPIEQVAGDLSATHRITVPGVYFLTADVVAELDKHAILIDADGVVLDLGGFAVLPSPATTAQVDGIRVEAGCSDIEIRNGVIRDWPRDGVAAAQSSQLRLNDLRVQSCVGWGIRGDVGLTAERCFILGNGVIGLFANAGASIVDCTVEANGANGVIVGDASAVVRTHSRSNAGPGISVGARSLVRDSVADLNTDGGIATLADAQVVDCVITATRSNNNAGLTLGSYARASRCVVNSSIGTGVILNRGSVIEDSVVSGNSTFGIASGPDCQILRNEVADSIVGIRTLSPRVTIDGNRVVDVSNTGIQVLAADCLVVRNTVGGISSPADFYDIDPGSSFGPLIDLRAGGDAGLVAGSDHPLANLLY